MYAILTIFAAFISLMFVATAVSSIVTAFREGEAVRVAASRRITF